jgi:hypothetical protein
MPAQRKKRLVVLSHIIKDFELGKKYPEREMNEIMMRYHPDYATLRRELIIHQFMYRKDGQYELNPPELWNLH